MNNQFSENLKRIRKENHLSQEQLADELGVSRQAISKWESSVAYPEMDKIIALCETFNVNIDDLLHKDIKELKKEEESRKTLNKTIDDFLNFITDTINLFGNMNFKSKIQCLFEQAMIIFVLTLISVITIQLISPIFLSLLEFLPDSLKYFIHNVFTSILILFCLISSIVILTHVFKTRYLDYYAKLKKEISSEEKNISNQEKSKSQEIIDKKNKILFRNNEHKIIIRDPKHSEYRFINSLLKIIVGIIKFLAFYIALFIFVILIVLFTCFIMSFLVYKTGLFFIGLLITILSSAAITMIILIIILNFIWNRKNEKKKMIWSFLISLIVLGCGLGFLLIGTLNFEIRNNDETMLKKEEIEFEMKEDTFFQFYTDNVSYRESNIDKIKVEYKINKYCQSKSYRSRDGIHLFGECNDPIKIAKEFINNVNNRKIITMNNELKDIVIYASKENIEKLKQNEENARNIQNEYNNIINDYEQRIGSLEEKIANDEIKFAEYEEKIFSLNNQNSEYKEKLKTYSEN